MKNKDFVLIFPVKWHLTFQILFFRKNKNKILLISCLLKLPHGFIYYTLFSDYILVWRSFEIVLMEIYAEEGIWW